MILSRFGGCWVGLVGNINKETTRLVMKIGTSTVCELLICLKIGNFVRFSIVIRRIYETIKD